MTQTGQARPAAPRVEATERPARLSDHPSRRALGTKCGNQSIVRFEYRRTAAQTPARSGPTVTGDQQTKQRRTVTTDPMVVRLNERFAIFKPTLAFPG
ncbi:hypothetical protein [Methylobacterium sp. J-070]|uniref:hypothetical protein n=1 Tax=Methylobacterium sp. J-070 TaxID=2836650 RepID=UPI001FB97FB1|nr:hypothetical protein [Methylobacterium sp. J-070]MCJ2051536.1 hypothetical protein [Methylobacterium sp. J-070]